ncbi:MAG: hypothetical protein KDB14_28305 [Planctomycetales bacterium]|nr:hypothetical protein [Planctomycetales bacterium]
MQPDETTKRGNVEGDPSSSQPEEAADAEVTLTDGTRMRAARATADREWLIGIKEQSPNELLCLLRVAREELEPNVMSAEMREALFGGGFVAWEQTRRLIKCMLRETPEGIEIVDPIAPTEENAKAVAKVEATRNRNIAALLRRARGDDAQGPSF